MAAEDVLREILIGRDDVGIAQIPARMPDRCVVVARSVIRIDHDGNAEFILQIEQALLHVACNNGDTINTNVAKLADKALNQNLTANFEQRFGTLKGQRSEGGSCACS